MKNGIDDFVVLGSHTIPRSGDEDRHAVSIGFGDAIRFLRRRKWLILSLVLLGTGLALIVASVIPPRYSANATLVFERSDTRLLQVAADFESEQLDFGAIETEMDVLRTRLFAGRVVDELGLAEDPDFGARPAQKSLIGRIVGDIKEFVQPTVPTAPAENSGAGATAEDTATPAAIPETTAVAPKARDQAIDVFLHNLTIWRSGDSLAISIRVADENATRAAAHANAVGRVYIDWSLEMKRRAADTFFEFFRTRAQNLEERIAQLEREIARFSAQNDVNSSRQDDTLRNEIAQITLELWRTKADRSAAQARLDQARTLAGADEAGAVLLSDLLSTLRGDMVRLRREEADLAASLGPNHPDRLAVLAEIASTEDMMATETGRITLELANEVEIVTARIEEFERELAALKTQLRSRAVSEIRLREMETNLVFERRRYDEVLNSLGNLDQQAEVLTPSARLLSEASVPGRPSFPNIPVIFAGTALGSGLAAMIVALLIEGFDTRIRTEDALRRILGTHNLAYVPRLRRKSVGRTAGPHVAVTAGTDPDYTEAICEVLRETERAATGTPARIVLVTSSLQDEGSGDLALSLAASAGIAGRRTLLIGLNPQFGRLSEKLGLGSKITSLDAFIFSDSSLADCLLPCPGAPEIDVTTMSSGSRDPRMVLDGARLQTLLTAVRQTYEYVVIDGPPILLASDFELIAERIDAVVLAVRWGRTREETLHDVADHLKERTVPLIGTAIMEVHMRKHAAGSYGGRPQYRWTASRRQYARGIRS